MGVSKYKKKKKLGAFPNISVMFSIALALFLIGLFGLLIIHSHKLKGVIRSNITMQVYLDKFITENERIRINQLLQQKEYIAIESELAPIEFIPKEDAAKVLIDKTGEDFVELLGENPLHDAFVIRIAPEYQMEESLGSIKAELGNLESVHEVVYVKNLVQLINSNVAKISILLMVVTVILLIVTAVLINNTIKLALFSQRFLIRSMQLVGAKTGFVIKPFVRRAGLQGMVAGLLASALLYGLLSYANRMIDDLQRLQSLQELLALFAALLMLGVAIGVISTYRAVRKYLKMSLDELY
jgi:cell division transport system permease protein